MGGGLECMGGARSYWLVLMLHDVCSRRCLVRLARASVQVDQSLMLSEEEVLVVEVGCFVCKATGESEWVEGTLVFED